MANKFSGKDIWQRVVVAIVGIPILIGAAVAGPNWSVWVIIAVAALIGCHELLTMTLNRTLGKTGYSTLITAGIALALCYWVSDLTSFLGAAFLAMGVSLVGEIFAGRPMEVALKRAQAGFFSWLYITTLFGAYILLIQGSDPAATWEHQAGWFLFPMFIIWAGDTGAYFGGKQFGKHQLAPSVSPKKSVEGAISGVIWSIGFGYVCWWFFLRDVIPAPFVAVYALPAAIIGQVGDLAESVIKRGTGFKDSGSILMGHGGMLDRVDGLIVAAPYIYLLRELVPAATL